MSHNLGHHALPAEVEEQIRGHLETAHHAQVMGTSERRKLQVIPSSNGEPKTFLAREEGFVLEGNGNFVQEQYDRYYPLDCGCTITTPGLVGGVDYLGGDVVCSYHLVYCSECRRSIAVYRAREVGGRICCGPCATKVTIKALLFFPLRVVKEICLGLVGMEVEKNNATSSFQPDRRPPFSGYYPQQGGRYPEAGGNNAQGRPIS